MLKEREITAEGNKLLKQEVYQLGEKNKILRKIKKIIEEV